MIRELQPDVAEWLLDGDPSIRWQVMSDVLGVRASAVKRERRRVATEGWGARLLASQDRTGTWGGGLYNPKWTSTTYTMLLLRDFGLPPNASVHRACALLLDNGLRPDGGVNFGRPERSETCITGMVLSIVCRYGYDDRRLDTIADYLLDQQMPDGGWNCRYPRGAVHASVNTTISVLEGLRDYQLHRRRKHREVRAAQSRGREFLLVHHLFRSHRTGRIIKPEFTRLSFPPRWHYDILRALDYFQSVDAPRDPRLEEAIGLLRKKQRLDGRWPLEHIYTGKSFFQLERVGSPSRWITMRALRVLRWWENAHLPHTTRHG